MDRFFTAVLWLNISWLCACQESILTTGTWSLTSDEVLLEVQISDDFWGQKACIDMVSSVVMTEEGCIPAEVDVADGVLWLEIPVITAVGDMNFIIRVHNGVVKVPQSSLDGYVEGVLNAVEVDSSLMDQQRRQTRLRIAEQRLLWETGAFSLQNEQNEIKGAFVFVQNEVRVMVFDRHWLTPEIQYSSIANDGLDWLISFEAEPQFFDVPTYVRVHPLELTVSIPQGERRSKEDIQYKLVPNPPPFEVLEVLKQKQIEVSIEEEQSMITEKLHQILSQLTTEEACLSWLASGVLQTPFWLGYDVSTSWEDHDCTVQIEPSIVQYRRVFTATVTGQSVKHSIIKP